MVLPAVGLVLALGLGLVQLGVVQVRLTDAAADAARLIGRGESAAARVASAQPGAIMAVSRSAPLVCVTVTATVSPPGAASLPGFTFTGTGCALDDTLSPPP